MKKTIELLEKSIEINDIILKEYAECPKLKGVKKHNKACLKQLAKLYDKKIDQLMKKSIIK